MARPILWLFALAPLSSAQAPTVLEELVGDDGARLGWSLGATGDVSGDGVADYVAGAPRDDTAASSAGRVVVFSGADASPVHEAFGDAQSDQLGYAVCGAGELTGDTRAEFAAGAPFDDDNGSASGLVRVYRGDTGTVLREWRGLLAGDEFGRSIANAGDVDNDGISDLIVGAPQSISGDLGYARVFSGATGGMIWEFLGTDPQSAFGISVAGVGDVDKDGWDDVIIGAYQDDQPGLSRGRAYVYSGQDAGLIRSHDGLADFDWFGWSVAGAGDVNADTWPDYIVGAYGADPGGDTSGQARVFSGEDGALLLTLDGSAPGENLGWSVDGAGDLDGDGRDDLIVGAPVAGAGAARTYAGSDGALLMEIAGADDGDQRGRAVAGAGADSNADGFPDLLIGAPLDDDNGSSSGTLLLVSGYQPWESLGGGTSGASGVPSLVGGGPLVGGTTLSVSLTQAPAGALEVVWVSASPFPVPLFGGTLHAFPISAQVFFLAGPAGETSASSNWPPGLPSGVSLTLQFLVQDPTVGFGITLSNAVRGTTP